MWHLGVGGPEIFVEGRQTAHVEQVVFGSCWETDARRSSFGRPKYRSRWKESFRGPPHQQLWVITMDYGLSSNMDYHQISDSWCKNSDIEFIHIVWVFEKSKRQEMEKWWTSRNTDPIHWVWATFSTATLSAMTQTHSKGVLFNTWDFVTLWGASPAHGISPKNVNTRMNVENNHVKITTKPKIRRQ